MSFSLDANILLYASDGSNPLHARAATFLDGCMSSGDVWYLGWPTVMAYLRISTHPSIFRHPLAPGEAMTNIETLLALPQVRFLSEGTDFWKRYRLLAAQTPLRGNLVPDTHLAAILLGHGVRRIYSRDKDFRKFPGLEVIDPLAETRSRPGAAPPELHPTGE